MSRQKIMKVYEQVFYKSPTYKFLKSGRAAGKSTAGGQKTSKTFFEEDGDIVVFRSNYADIKQSIYQEIVNVIVDLELFMHLEIKQKPLTIHNKLNGNTIYFLGIGGADVHRTKGFKPNKGYLSLIVGEELQQVPQQANLDESMATFLRYLKDDGEVLYMFNPDRRASHWCNEYFRLKKHDPNFYCLHTNYKQIGDMLSKHLLTEIEVERVTNPSNYRHRYLGETEGLFGAVYASFDREKHLVTEEQIKELINKIGVHQLFIGVDPAQTRDSTAIVPVLLLKNGQGIVLNYFFHDPSVNGVITNARLAPIIKRWLDELIRRWNLNPNQEIQMIFDSQATDLRLQIAHTFPRNVNPQSYSQKNIIEMAQYMQNAFSKNVLFILDEGGIYNYITDRFVKGLHPLVTQLEQVIWNEAGDGFEKKVPNDATDALTYAVAFYFKNPANLHLPQLQYYYKPLSKERGESK